MPGFVWNNLLLAEILGGLGQTKCGIASTKSATWDVSNKLTLLFDELP